MTHVAQVKRAFAAHLDSLSYGPVDMDGLAQDCTAFAEDLIAAAEADGDEIPAEPFDALVALIDDLNFRASNPEGDLPCAMPASLPAATN